MSTVNKDDKLQVNGFYCRAWEPQSVGCGNAYNCPDADGDICGHNCLKWEKVVFRKGYCKLIEGRGV